MVLLILVLSTVLACAGCGADMRIAPALFTQEDQQNPLLSKNGRMPDGAYAYQASDKLRSVHTALYQLDADKTWKSLGSSATAAQFAEGRVMVFLPSGEQGYCIVVQVGDGTSDYAVGSNQMSVLGTNGALASSWQEDAGIVYEQEIPLAILYAPVGNDAVVYGIDSFKNPPQPKDGEKIFAVTVRFSERPLG